MKTVAIIGAGQIGFAAAQAFTFNDWDVTVYARSRPPWLVQGVEFSRHDITKSPPPRADAVVDTIAFDSDDIEHYDPDHVGRLIAISSASVYCDDRGRTLDEAAQNGFPEFDGPISEDQPTVAAGPDTYSTRKVRMENRAIALFGERATILRPCAVHGPWSRHPREWWFVKRLLDGRKRIPLAFAGSSEFQTTATRMIGDFACHAAIEDCEGVFNLADAECPTVADIGWAIGQHMQTSVELVPMDGPPMGSVGRTPWSVSKPFAVSWYKAFQSGFEDENIYFTAPEGTHWLADNPPADWRAAFPQLAAYPWDMFDYEAEDAYFASL